MLNEEVHHNRKENSRTMCGESIIYALAFGAVQIVGVQLSIVAYTKLH